MLLKQDLLKLLKKESATTVKMMHAFPEEKATFKPHERSQEAIRLMTTFVFETYLISTYVFGDMLDRSRFQTYKPDSVATAIADFEKETAIVIERLQECPEVELNKIVEFGDHTFTADEFILMMIHDQIHHRGQLAVYVRMAGGKVPSIYGPSADDTSTNL